MSKNSQDIITTAEAAAEVRVNDQTVRDWIKVGYLGRRLVATRYGRRWKIARSDWEAFKHYITDPLGSDSKEQEND